VANNHNHGLQQQQQQQQPQQQQQEQQQPEQETTSFSSTSTSSSTSVSSLLISTPFTVALTTTLPPSFSTPSETVFFPAVKSLPESQNGGLSFFIKIVYSDEYQISIHVVLAGSLSLLSLFLVKCLKWKKNTKKENLEELLTVATGHSRFYTITEDPPVEDYHSVQDLEM
jgi:hypothetical protein